MGSTFCTCPVATWTRALHHSYSSDQYFSDFILMVTEQSRREQTCSGSKSCIKQLCGVTVMPDHPFHCGGHRCATNGSTCDLICECWREIVNVRKGKQWCARQWLKGILLSNWTAQQQKLRPTNSWPGAQWQTVLRPRGHVCPSHRLSSGKPSVRPLHLLRCLIKQRLSAEMD